MTEAQAHKQAVIELLKARSLQVGDFLLASGKSSKYYIDARPTTMSAAGQESVGAAGFDAILRAGWLASAVGGMTLGADPVAYAIARASLGSERPLDGFTVRKEPKDHGRGRQIEGNFSEGLAVIIVEDVITSGGSALTAARIVEGAGGRVVGVFAVVDRQQGGRAAIEAAGYPVQALVNIDELGVHPD